MAKISIIIPIYNAEKYVKKCIQSVVDQTLKDIEIICVDDGSADSSVQIMDEFAESDSRVRVIHKPNSGYGNSMNIGVSSATGEYIGIVESDDYIVEDMYETLYALTEESTVDVVKANFADCYDEKDGSITKVVNEERKNMPPVQRSFTIREFPQILWGHPSIWTGIYRRSFLNENGIRFKEEKGGGWVDNPFFFDTLCSAKKIRWINKPLYCYRKTNEASSSVGYDLKIPFERMCDNLDVLNSRRYNDEEILKFAYARALMYLVGATKEPHYPYNEDYARPYMQKMLSRINPDVLYDDFNVWDNKTYHKYLSPIATMSPKTAKILFYNWIPFDNPGKFGGGVTIYCKNIIESLLRYRPDIEIYFISSGWAYDITKNETYVRKINNVFGERCKTFEIVNSPIPAAQDMLFNNPTVAFENATLKDVFKKFIEKTGPFTNIHFNNIEGISLDILDLKDDYPETQFVYSMHNYVPICMTGFYYQRHNHCNCNPDHTVEDCDKCINRKNKRVYSQDIINRAKYGVNNPDQYPIIPWATALEIGRLDEINTADTMVEFVNKATAAINKNMDKVLAVSDRVRVLAEENGINPKLIQTSYIGTKVANYQVGKSTASKKKHFKIVYLGSNLFYEEKGYPFLIKSLNKLEKEYADQIDLVLTTTTKDKDDYIREKLNNYHSVRIIHGYSHGELAQILKGANLGIIPVLWEDNLPQIAIEMVAYGVPILCSDAGGASELCSSDMFKFSSGDSEELLKKIKHFVDNRNDVDEYWKYHKGLVTLKEHLKELLDVFEIGIGNDITLSIEEYANLVNENEFLYAHFQGEGNINEYNKIKDAYYSLQRQLEDARNYQKHLEEEINIKQTEIEEIVQQRNYLQYSIDETRKSTSYKVGRAVTLIPRKIRGDK